MQALILHLFCREFTSETLEKKTKELSHTVVSFFLGQVCTTHMHMDTQSLLILKLEENSANISKNCVHVNVNKSTCLSFHALSRCAVTLRRHDIFSEFDFSNFSAQLLHNPSFPTPPSLSLSLSALRLPRGVRHRDSNCSWFGRSPHHDISPKTPGRSHSPSITFSESSLSLSQKKAKVRSDIF